MVGRIPTLALMSNATDNASSRTSDSPDKLNRLDRPEVKMPETNDLSTSPALNDERLEQ